MISPSKGASAALANACWYNFRSLTQRHHPSRNCRLVPTALLQLENKFEISRFHLSQKVQFFGSTIRSKSQNNNGDDHCSDTKLVPPGQASITLEGGWTEENDFLKTETKKEKSQPEHSLFTMPIIVEMPRIDEEDGDPLFFVEKWHKSPGDPLEKDDVLCEISTPDFSFGMQIDDEETGIMGEIHAEEGLKVGTGVPICTIYHKDQELQ